MVVDDVGADPGLKGWVQHFAAVLAGLHVVEAAEDRFPGDPQLGCLSLASPLQGQQVRVLLGRVLAGAISDIRLLIEVADTLDGGAAVDKPVGGDTVVFSHHLDLVHKVLSQNRVGLVPLELQIPPQQHLHAGLFCLGLKGEQACRLGCKGILDFLAKFFLRDVERAGQQDILHDAAQDGCLDDAHIHSGMKESLAGAGVQFCNRHKFISSCFDM